MSHDVGYEKSDVVVKKIVIATSISAAVMAVCLFGLDQYFLLANEKMYFNHVLKPESLELKELRQKEMQILTNYKILDKNRGIYQIPIERAMELEVSQKSK